MESATRFVEPKLVIVILTNGTDTIESCNSRRLRVAELNIHWQLGGVTQRTTQAFCHFWHVIEGPKPRPVKSRSFGIN